jgi:beta-N-acetylhexosaminidase
MRGVRTTLSNRIAWQDPRAVGGLAIASLAALLVGSVTAAQTSPSPSRVESLGPGVAATSCASTVLGAMTERQRIGQLFIVGLSNDGLTNAERSAIADDHIGSWWYTTQTSAGVAAIRSVSDSIQALATQAATRRVGFFLAANQEGGLIQALSGPGFDTIPSALTQGTWSTTTLETRAARWGRQLAAAGGNLDAAPVADVVPPGVTNNAPIGELDREFGHYPRPVARHVAAFVRGMDQAGEVTTAKHFPGLGRVVANTDFASGVVDRVTTYDDPYLAPFRRAVNVGVPIVMVSLAIYERIDPHHIAAFSHTVIGGMLRNELGFHGLVMSDSLTAAAVQSIPPGRRAIRFLAAGGDMIVVTSLSVALTMADALAARASASSTFRHRMNNAAFHVLRAKEAAGLLPCSS